MLAQLLAFREIIGVHNNQIHMHCNRQLDDDNEDELNVASHTTTRGRSGSRLTDTPTPV